LAELIQNISNAARQQASSAGHISNTMNVIQEITSQTSAGTNATAKAIGNLSEMANALRESVTGFKLPDEIDIDESLSAANGFDSGHRYEADGFDMDSDADDMDEDEVIDLSLDDALSDDEPPMLTN